MTHLWPCRRQWGHHGRIPSPGVLRVHAERQREDLKREKKIGDTTPFERAPIFIFIFFSISAYELSNRIEHTTRYGTVTVALDPNEEKRVKMKSNNNNNKMKSWYRRRPLVVDVRAVILPEHRGGLLGPVCEARQQ